MGIGMYSIVGNVSSVSAVTNELFERAAIAAAAAIRQPDSAVSNTSTSIIAHTTDEANAVHLLKLAEAAAKIVGRVRASSNNNSTDEELNNSSCYRHIAAIRAYSGAATPTPTPIPKEATSSRTTTSETEDGKPCAEGDKRATSQLKERGGMTESTAVMNYATAAALNAATSTASQQSQSHFQTDNQTQPLNGSNGNNGAASDSVTSSQQASASSMAAAAAAQFYQQQAAAAAAALDPTAAAASAASALGHHQPLASAASALDTPRYPWMSITGKYKDMATVRVHVDAIAREAEGEERMVLPKPFALTPFFYSLYLQKLLLLNHMRGQYFPSQPLREAAFLFDHMLHIPHIC